VINVKKLEQRIEKVIAPLKLPKQKGRFWRRTRIPSKRVIGKEEEK
jgi:hypothetical protein